MKNHFILYLATIIILVGPINSRADDSLQALSPGSADDFVAVEWRCPTFSWTRIEGATYELVVTKLDRNTFEVTGGAVSIQRMVPAGRPAGRLQQANALSVAAAMPGRFMQSINTVLNMRPRR